MDNIGRALGRVNKTKKSLFLKDTHLFRQVVPVSFFPTENRTTKEHP